MIININKTNIYNNTLIVCVQNTFKFSTVSDTDNTNKNSNDDALEDFINKSSTDMKSEPSLESVDSSEINVKTDSEMNPITITGDTLDPVLNTDDSTTILVDKEEVSSDHSAGDFETVISLSSSDLVSIHNENKMLVEEISLQFIEQSKFNNKFTVPTLNYDHIKVMADREKLAELFNIDIYTTHKAWYEMLKDLYSVISKSYNKLFPISDRHISDINRLLAVSSSTQRNPI